MELRFFVLLNMEPFSAVALFVLLNLYVKSGGFNKL